MPLVWSLIKGRWVTLKRTGTCQGAAEVLRDGVCGWDCAVRGEVMRDSEGSRGVYV